MSRLVAFLRGINLGDRRVTNDELRSHFENLGLECFSSAPADVNVYVTFLREAADDGVDARLTELETPDDRFRVEGREVVWLRRGGISDSDISTRDFETALGGSNHTRRNLNTVRRILSKYGS